MELTVCEQIRANLAHNAGFFGSAFCILSSKTGIITSKPLSFTASGEYNRERTEKKRPISSCGSSANIRSVASATASQLRRCICNTAPATRTGINRSQLFPISRISICACSKSWCATSQATRVSRAWQICSPVSLQRKGCKLNRKP